MSLIALIEWYLRATTRSKAGLISYGMGPLSFLFLITIISGGELLPTAIIGGIITFAIDRGLIDLPIEIAGMRTRSRFYEIFLSLPVRPVVFALGVTIGMSIVSIPYLATLTATLLLIEEPRLTVLPPILLVIASLWIWSSMVGLYIGTRVKDPTSIIRVANIVVTTLTVFPPVYYPLELLPAPLHQPLLLIPTVSAAYLLRAIFEPLPYQNHALIILVVHLAIATILGTRILKIKED